MAIFKCKMCGGALEISENQFVATCEYCGTKQTLPKLDNEKKIALFSRANNLRIKSEFDKAAGIYESIIAEFRDEAEAYWGLVLCKYGIEYVDDGKGSRVPTCHRTLPLSVMDDDDFQQACENADITAKTVYRDEAKAIDKIQKKILNIALSEEPYDIFICYKETDDITGSRTEDSLIAQDIYTELLKDGYRVFFARDSLREVAGAEYEPYIYAALSSAKIMLAIGTKHDYYDAVWVKNEWSRFISMMSDDLSKVLIPCFKNMDAYDMPKEFKNMQALDMGEVTFFGSLTENIERILDKSKGKAIKETIVVNKDNIEVAPLLERGFMFLEDEEWDRADEFFEKVLNKDPKNARAYLGKLLADLEVSSFEKLSEFHTTFSDSNFYEKIMRFADSDLKERVKNSNNIIARRVEDARKKALYEDALEIMQNATTEDMFENAGYMFVEVKDYADAKEKSEECFLRAEDARKDEILFRAKDSMYGNDTINYLTAIELLKEIPGWKDSDEIILKCKKKIEEILETEEADRIKQEKQSEIIRKRYEEQQKLSLAKAKRTSLFATIGLGVTAFVLLLILLLNHLN
ncbi:MAG: TIR domain-containing protein [Clostridia bacterium]|nr:TIR domain-containing protein [Clostridia bacterium]